MLKYNSTTPTPTPKVPSKGLDLNSLQLLSSMLGRGNVKTPQPEPKEATPETADTEEESYTPYDSMAKYKAYIERHEAIKRRVGKQLNRDD